MSTPTASPSRIDEDEAPGSDADVSEFGYTQRFARTIRSFDSFAIAFSFISITTGIFTTFGFVLNTGGPRGIWTWPIVIIGQMLVAAVFAALAARLPLSGYSYQWGSRLATPHVGWWLGWLSMCFLFIVVVSVDYALVQVAFQPLIGQEYTPRSAALWTLAVIVLQAAIIIRSTRTTARVNSAAVVTEVVGIVALIVALVAAALVSGDGSVSNLGSTGVVEGEGWYGWLGPFMLSTLLGAYTIVGFEAASNLAEETEDPRRVVPTAMLRAVALSGILGMVFLVALVVAIADIPAATAEAAPVAFIVEQQLGSVAQKLFLAFICVSIFACGLINMITNSRLIWAMGRDGRLPGSRLWQQVPRSTGGPTWATALAAGVSAAIVAVLHDSTDTLVTVLSAATIMPALIYASTVVLYAATRKRLPRADGYFTLGRWETPVLVGAAVWLVYELTVLILPEQFRDAQYYVLGVLGLGAVVYAVQLATNREALSGGGGREPGPGR